MHSLIAFPFLLLTLLLTNAADAKKEKPLFDPFPRDVVDGISCGVCTFMVKKAYGDVQELFNASTHTRVKVNEDDVLTSIEDICNPLSETGKWIRRLIIHPKGGAAPFLLEVEELPVYTKCKRTCSTVMEACEAVIDHESMDQLSPQLLHVQDYGDADAFAGALCESSRICTRRAGITARRYEEVRGMIEADVMEEIDPKEMEVERMMDQMERKENRRQTVFSRDEITQMQDAILRGDKDAVAQIDPTIGDLSNEEFTALQSMMRGRMMGIPKGEEWDNNEDNGIGGDQQINEHSRYYNDDGNDDDDDL